MDNTIKDTKKSTRVDGQYWSFLLWEDSYDPLYAEIMDSKGIRWIESCWHDNDTWTALDERENPLHVANTKKKKHKHIWILYNNVTTLNNIQKIYSEFGSYFKKMNGEPRDFINYATHEKNPSKFHYDEKPICHGFDINDLKGKEDKENEEQLLLADIENIIFEHNIIEYKSIVKYLNSQMMFAHKKVLVKFSYHINSLIKSIKFSNQDELALLKQEQLLHNKLTHLEDLD